VGFARCENGRTRLRFLFLLGLKKAMPLQIRCRHCERTFVAPREVMGQKIPCPRCGQTITIPKVAPTHNTPPSAAKPNGNHPDAIPVAQPVHDTGDSPSAVPMAQPVNPVARPVLPQSSTSKKIPPSLPPRPSKDSSSANIDVLLREGAREEEAGILLLDASLGPISRVLDGWERELRKSIGLPLRGHGVVAFCVTRPLSVIVLLLAIVAGVLTFLSHPVVPHIAAGVLYALAGLLIFQRGMNWEIAGTKKYRIATGLYLALAALAISEDKFAWMHALRDQVVSLLQQEGVMTRPKPIIPAPPQPQVTPPTKPIPGSTTPPSVPETPPVAAGATPPTVIEATLPVDATASTSTNSSDATLPNAEPPSNGEEALSRPASLITTTDFRTLANRAYLAGNSVDGLDFLQAAALNAEKTIGSGKGLGEDPYYWVAALQRPVVTLRWGLGVFYEGHETTNPLKTDGLQLGPNFRADQMTLEKQFLEVCDLPGQAILDLFEKNYSDRNRKYGDMKWPPSGRRQKGQGVVLLGCGSQTELLVAARKMRLDCLALVELKDTLTSSGNKMLPDVQLRINVFNVASQEPMFATEPLSKVKMTASKSTGGKPIDAFIAKFDKWQDQTLKLVELDNGRLKADVPSKQGLTDEVITHEKAAEVANAVVGAVQNGKETLLAGLVTIKYLHEQKLLSDKELSESYATLAGEEFGQGLLGNAKQRRAVIDKWVPRQNAPSSVQ
jgi:phage FluMu protein Com